MTQNDIFKMEKINISVIIPTFNEEKNISKLLKALLGQSFLPDEIIISDGQSTDNTLQIISNLSKKNKLIKIINRKGKCRGSGRNEGIKSAKNNLLALIDSGTIPDKDWLLNFVKYLKQNKKFDVIFGSVFFKTNNIFDESYATILIDKNLDNKNYLIPSVASMFIKKSIWEEIGGFSESIDGSYNAEDISFKNNIKKSKYNIIYEKNAKIYWIITFSIKKIFKRFYEYSLGSLKAGYFKTWHKGLLRNILFFIFLIYLSFQLSFLFLLFLIFLLFLKSFSYLRFMKWYKKSNIFKKLYYIFITTIVFSLVDISSILGWVRWIILGSPRFNK